PGADPKDKATIANHCGLIPEVVAVGSRWRKKESMRIIERIERARDVRERHIKRRRAVDFVPGLGDPGIPIQAVEFGIVVMFAYIIGDHLQHGAGAIAIEAGKLS